MQKVIRILQLRIFGDKGDGSTSSQEVSHASPFPLPAGERARRTAVTSGLTCSVPFTRSGQGWIVGENVGGILTMVQPGKAAHVGCQPSLFGEDQPVYRKREEYVVETICRDLEREGYTVQPLLIPACAVGAPHRRDRIWFVAHADGEGLQPEGTELSPEGSSGNHPRDVAAHPDSDGDTPPAAGGTLETSRDAHPCTRRRTGRRTPTARRTSSTSTGCSRRRRQGTGRAHRPWKISKGRGRTRIGAAFPISLPGLGGVSNSIPCLWPR